MAIYPVTNPVDLAQAEIIRDRGINFLFDFDKGDFVIKAGKFIELIGDAAVVFWIEKTLRTEYETSQVYRNTDYGTVLNSLRGRVLAQAVIKTMLETNIKNALLKHERIRSIDNFQAVQDLDEVEISFEVILNPIEEIIDLDSSEEGFNRISTLEQIKDFIGIKLLTKNKFVFKTKFNEYVYVK